MSVVGQIAFGVFLFLIGLAISVALVVLAYELWAGAW